MSEKLYTFGRDISFLLCKYFSKSVSYLLEQKIQFMQMVVLFVICYFEFIFPFHQQLLSYLFHRLKFIIMKQESEHHTKFPMLPQDKITLVAITWNLFGSLPTINSLVEFASSSAFRPKPDLIFFGTQQCQRSLCMAFCCEGKSEWEAMLAEAFPQYDLVATETMTGLHSAILVTRRLREHFELQIRNRLKAGVCNLMGNKGAISIQAAILGQQFQFINCHLAPHQHQSAERNATISRILDTLLRKDLHSQVILLGDLNYRIDMSESEYKKLIEGKKNTDNQMNYLSFSDRDQLNNQVDLRKDFLLRFQEGDISFAPTYKIGVNSKQYSRERIPGWTDRIFHRKGKVMKRITYGCLQNIMGSDHRPVFARYQKTVDEGIFSLASQNYIAVRSRNCQLI